jgi:ubiquinone/menaquinone biosynthesis C-methylase UbiE
MPSQQKAADVGCNLMKTYISIFFLVSFNFLFGQVYPSLDSIKTLKQLRLDTILSVIKLKEGDVIADIGSGKGYNLIRLANKFPKTTFFVQDIDTTVCNKKTFLKTMKTFNSNLSIDNFHFFKGSETSTNLPKEYFDKVFLIAVIHEFTKLDSMLKDVKSIIKENGEFIIEEPLVRHSIKKEKGCNNPYLTEIQLKEILEKNQIVIIESKYIKDIGNNKYRMVFRCKKGYSQH